MIAFIRFPKWREGGGEKNIISSHIYLNFCFDVRGVQYRAILPDDLMLYC